MTLLVRRTHDRGAGKVLSEGRLGDEKSYAGRPSVCRSCGALVGAGESNCMMCGAPVAAVSNAAQRAEEPEEIRRADPETRRFIRAVVSRPAPFTFIFLTLCVFLFLLMKASGVDEHPLAVLDAYGAKINSRIDAGEWWRFATPIFLHGGPAIGWIHLLVNMYGLFMLGPYVEKLYGSAKFTFFWVATGIGGTAASYLTVRPGVAADGALARFIFSEADVPSVGASGALFGLVGVLFVFGIKFRRELPEGFKRAFGTGMLPMIVINLFIGFTVPVIDNAAHLGGLVTGCALALFVDYKRPGPRGPVAVAWHAAQGAALALVVISFAMVAHNFGGPAPGFANLRKTSDAAVVPVYVDATNEGQAAIAKAVNERDGEAARKAIEKLNSVPPLGDATADALRDELKALLARASDILAADAPDGAARETQLAQLVTDFEEWEGRFDGWVKAEGERFGIYLKPSPEPAGEQK